MKWLGLDIGGANLKAADGRGWARSVPFPLWRQPNQLAAALAELLESAPHAGRIAVTMTGELCDAFRTKAEGVRHILDAVEGAARKREVVVYQVNGRLVLLEEAREVPELATASNWHALATFACRYGAQGSGLLIDIGSTTTDIIPLVGGQPAPRGLNDTDRLVSGELVYCGVGRTPLCALVGALPWGDATCPVAAELFATTADAYVLLGETPELADDTNTADGRPLTKKFARERMARMICADSTTFSEEDAIRAAKHVRRAQLCEVSKQASNVVAAMTCSANWVVTGGAGEFLGSAASKAALPNVDVVSLSRQIGAEASRCAPAHGLAVIAAERC